MYIFFLPRVGLYVTKFYPERKRGVKSWQKGLPVVKTIYAYGFHELFRLYLDCTTNITRGGIRGGVRGVCPPEIRKAYVIQRLLSSSTNNFFMNGWLVTCSKIFLHIVNTPVVKTIYAYGFHELFRF
jgi:hypothetical protein